MTTVKSLLACALLVATLGAAAVPASAMTMMSHHKHMMMHKKMMMHHKMKMMHHHKMMHPM